MKKIFGLIGTGLILVAFSGFSQTLMINSNRMPLLEVFAGEDVPLIRGNATILGGRPTALNGYGGFTYLWNPATGLDDPTKANPLCTPDVTSTYTVMVTDAKHCSVQDEVTITVSASGIDERKQTFVFTVFPNPADGKLTIEVKSVSAEPLRVSVINSVGQVVQEYKSPTAIGFSKELNIGSWTHGYYLVLLNLNGEIHTQRFIIN